MATRYFDSGNRFTDPVRYFKANDPYYYEVDNIPVKQLEENSKWLKDQVDGILKNLNSQGFDRDLFSELKPYVTGADSKVKVLPGRFTARINDAYTKAPLQVITQTLGTGNNSLDEVNQWSVQTVKGADVSAALMKWQEEKVENATLMNGLFERTFVYPMKNNDLPGEGVDTGDPTILDGSTNGLLSGRASWPGLKGYLQTFKTSDLSKAISNPEVTGNFVDAFRNQGRIESDFIKRWRGAVRTAVVDVPTELELEIPRFSSEDFYYYDDNGNKQSLTSSQRIDLLFIYSKPIDQSETKVASYTNGVPKTLTAPTLGIVKGAGIGVNRTTSLTNVDEGDSVNLQSLDGVTLMLPNVSDRLAPDTGFATSAGAGQIRGSFPSPDDLMNLAPLLSENLSTTSVALIGQSILPVAYIVVKEIASPNALGQPIITKEDVIDIRPFFRTTELAYNERAGIAAATPQVSIANPVASEGYVEQIRTDIIRDYKGLAGTVERSARIVGAGSVKGGMLYGVEGALASYLKDQYNITTLNGAKAQVEQRYGYQTNSVPLLPDWDVARWCEQGSFTSKGDYPNDRINYFQWGLGGTQTPQQALKYSVFQTKPNNFGAALDPAFTSTTNRVDRLATGKFFHAESWNSGIDNEGDFGIAQFYFVKKTIRIDRSAIGWADDYHVAAQLANCVPLTQRANSSTTTNFFTNAGGVSNVWVEKKQNEFTIFVAWVGSNTFATGDGTSPAPFNELVSPAADRDNGKNFAGFAVINSDIMTAPNPNGALVGTGTESVTSGVAIYPTINFQVYGIPPNVASNGSSVFGTNSVLTLV